MKKTESWFLEINQRIKYLLLIISCALWVPNIVAIDYFVDANSGDDINDGLSWLTSFKTINRAKAVSAAGDHIRVNQGIYYEEIINPPSGTALLLITYEGIGEVIIDGQNLRDRGFYLSTSGNWTIIKNFHFQNCQREGVLAVSRAGVTITNCEFDNCGKIDQVTTLALSSCTDSTLSYNRLTNNYRGLYNASGSRNIINRNTCLNHQEYGLEYYNDNNGTRNNKITNNLVINGSNYGIYLSSFNLSSDIVSRNNSYNNNPNWRLNGGAASIFTDNLNVNPQFQGDTLFLSPTSPLIEAGTIDQATGTLSTIGAFGVGNISSNVANAWNGWIDQSSNAISASALVMVGAEGKIRLRDGVNETAILSPVIAKSDSQTLRGLHLDASQAPHLQTTEKQVIDQDNSTITPEIRYRFNDSIFSQTDTLPAWTSAFSGERLNSSGKYFQAELTLRKNGI